MYMNKGTKANRMLSVAPVCCSTIILVQQCWPLAILGEGSIQMMLVSKTITCHDSNRVKLIKSR